MLICKWLTIHCIGCHHVAPQSATQNEKTCVQRTKKQTERETQEAEASQMRIKGMGDRNMQN